MQDIIPSFTSAPMPRPGTNNIMDSTTEDNLGRMLQNKWSAWSQSRLSIENDWLRDLRSFNQIHEPDAKSLSKFHSHIFFGLTRTKCMSAYSRICDILFQTTSPHWDIAPTPTPNPGWTQGIDTPDIDEEAKIRAEAMKKELEDQLLDLKYEHHIKSAILEACIIGTGVIKGVTPGVKKIDKWVTSDTGEWVVETVEIPAPQMSSPSSFDIFPDPYAMRLEDLSGLFERHRLNRKQFAELKEDSRFDSAKIDELLRESEKGNHDPLSNETERNNIANVTDTATETGRYDLLEYWGQVTGRLLQSAGVQDVGEEETYWANVWTSAGRTLLAKVVPMKKQRIPYNFFFYSVIPHQFWGVAPSRMIRHTQGMINGSIQAMLDGLVMSAYPMAEVNVGMLQHGQDPNVMLPGMVYLKDNGDPVARAVHFFQPSSPTQLLLQVIETFKSFADDETALPAYTYGDQSAEVNKTAKGMSMQHTAAGLPLKLVVKNLEDFGIKPFLKSLFDWNMEWSDKEEIKGDMDIDVLATSGLMAKEMRNQQLMQFANITANPLDATIVDRKYLMTEIAKSMEIDHEKAIKGEEAMMPQEQPAQPSALDQAKVGLIEVQTQKERATIDKVDAEKTESVMRGMFSAIQAANLVTTNPAIAPAADAIFKSAGGKDYDGGELVATSPGAQPMDMPVNTSPGFPALPADSVPPQATAPQANAPISPAQDANIGIETPEIEPLN